MNVLSIFLVVFSVATAVFTALLQIFSGKKHKDEISFYQRNNDELRADNTDQRAKNADLEKENARLKAKSEEQTKRIADLQELNSKQPDFAGLTKLLSNNHKQVMTSLTQLAAKIVERSNDNN